MGSGLPSGNHRCSKWPSDQSLRNSCQTVSLFAFSSELSFPLHPRVNAAKVRLPMLPGPSPFRVPDKKMGTPCDLRASSFLIFVSILVTIISISLHCHVNIFLRDKSEGCPVLAKLWSWPDSPGTCSNAISELPQARSIHIHLLSWCQHLHSSLTPKILIHSIHPNILVPLIPQPSILPTLCCYRLTPTWIIQSNPKCLSASSPLHNPTHPRSAGPKLQYLLLSSTCATCLNTTAASSCLPLTPWGRSAEDRKRHLRCAADTGHEQRPILTWSPR